MTEETDEETHENSGMGDEGAEGGGSIEGQGGEGIDNQQATPPIKEQGVPGQTQVSAPDDDVGGQRGGDDRPE